MLLNVRSSKLSLRRLLGGRLTRQDLATKSGYAGRPSVDIQTSEGPAGLWHAVAVTVFEHDGTTGKNRAKMP